MLNIFSVIKNFFTPNKIHLNVLDTNDTIKYILETKCSISRFGDGEIFLMEGGTKPDYQKGSKILASKLSSVCTTNKCLICIPDLFEKKRFNKFLIKKNEYSFWSNYLKFFGPKFEKYFSKNKIIGDAFISRFYIRYNNHNNVENVLLNLKKIWERRDVVFVEGAETRLGVGNDLFSSAKSIRRIICPKKNAFSKYEEIKSSILDIANETDLIICALGPTATVLSFELSEKLQVLDLGHIDVEYEWYKMGAKKKMAVKNKYVNEVLKGRKPNKIIDKEYERQIVKIIGINLDKK